MSALSTLSAPPAPATLHHAAPPAPRPHTIATRRAVVRVVASLDGYIARRDGSLDWLPRPGLAALAGVDDAFLATVDTIVAGRKTHERILARETSPALAGKRRVIFSAGRATRSRANEEWLDCDVAALMRELRAEPGAGDVWVAGGAEIIAACLGGDVVDELTVTTVPMLLGEGVQLFPKTTWTTRLRLIAATTTAEGLARQSYAVRRD